MKKLIKFAKVAGYVGIHTNKAQHGASPWVLEELTNTPMHPTNKDSFGLMIWAQAVSHYSPLVESEYQFETSGYLDWVEQCNTTNLEECALLDPLYDAFHTLQECALLDPLYDAFHTL